MNNVKSATVSMVVAKIRHRSAPLFPTDAPRPASIHCLTDGELVERVRAGDTAAFGELVERHRGAVYRGALAALRNTADAEDVAQEALVLAFRKIGQFRGDASIRTWMVTIGWRLALRRRRSPLLRLKQMFSTDTAEAGLVEAVQPSAERQLLDGERLALVREQIMKLPAKLRDALLLTAAGDLTQDEIAVALKIPAATFRWRLMEARRRLREKCR
jgi:RNA polymerase sigma-70 factor (ECF subfamily)